MVVLLLWARSWLRPFRTREDKLALCGLCILIGYTLIQDLFAAADSDGCVSPLLAV